MTVKALHTADVHLDTVHHGKINPQTGIDVVMESNAATLKHLVNVAIEQEVDIFLLPGDIVSAGRPSAETMMMLADILQPLVDAGIPIELDEGNHERLFIPAMHRTPSNVLGRMLGSDAVHTVTSMSLKHYGMLDVLTIPYPPKSRILAALGQTRVDPTKGDGIVVRYVLEETARLLEKRTDTSIPLIISGHFTVDGIGLPGSEQDIANLMNEVVFPVKPFEEFNPAYIALGHIHTPQKLGTRTYYSGSPNKLTFTDASDIKGGNLVTIDGIDDHVVERILTPVRGMYKIDLDTQEFDLELRQNDVVQVLLREGESDVPKELKKIAADAGASLIPKPRPVRKAAIKRTILPEKISPISALDTHLNEQGIDKDKIKKLIAAAKALGAAGDTKGDSK